MLDGADAIIVPFDPPDSDIVWEHDLETCRRSGVQPVSRERADELIAEFAAALACRSVPPTTH